MQTISDGKQYRRGSIAVLRTAVSVIVRTSTAQPGCAATPRGDRPAQVGDDEGVTSCSRSGRGSRRLAS